jgi:predicted nucleic acid-binding Zn ribbon protein
VTRRRGDDEPMSIGDALARVQAELGLPESDALRTLTNSWAAIVGDDVAAHARLDALRDETISIVVDSTLWATQLRYLEADIVARANVLVGSPVVHGIRVRVEAFS